MILQRLASPMPQQPSQSHWPMWLTVDQLNCLLMAPLVVAVIVATFAVVAIVGDVVAVAVDVAWKMVMGVAACPVM